VGDPRLDGHRLASSRHCPLAAISNSNQAHPHHPDGVKSPLLLSLANVGVAAVQRIDDVAVTRRRSARRAAWCCEAIGTA
jgi:hypothetical protein